MSAGILAIVFDIPRVTTVMVEDVLLNPNRDLVGVEQLSGLLSVRTHSAHQWRNVHRFVEHAAAARRNDHGSAYLPLGC